MQDHTKLTVRHRARSLTVSMHEAPLAFPSGSAPGLRAQLMRATMSISANIAEGAAKSSRREFARYLEIAMGSASEAEHHLTVAMDLGVIGERVGARLATRAVEVRRMLFGLRRALLARDAQEQSDPDTSDAVDSSLSN